ncbi:MAG: GGDEF domain-containing protein [Deltaproteobacteria bacterium]|nr:GGDEF domain-containing protein [Deltaproteobacteria bacterium]
MQTLKQPQDYHLTAEDLIQFKRSVLAENVKRSFAIVILGIVLNFPVIALERQAFGQFDEITWLRLIWLAGGILYIAIIGKPGKKSYRFQKSLFLTAVGFSILFTAMISGQVATTQSNTFIFIINILLVSTFLVLPVSEFLGIAAPGILYLGIVMYRAMEGGLSDTLAGNIANIASVTALSILAAHLTYVARKQRFTYEIVIRRQNEVLKAIASLDGLTGIANRRKIVETAAAIEAFAVRDQISVAVFMIDMDDFKVFNDSHGHLAGDDLLKSAVCAMQNVLHRNSDLLGRYGGEEFIAILPSTDAAGAARVAEKMRQAVFDLAIPHPSTTAGVVTISIGFSVKIPSHDVGIQDIIQRADQALYRAKQSGKNRVESL